MPAVANRGPRSWLEEDKRDRGALGTSDSRLSAGSEGRNFMATDENLLADHVRGDSAAFAELVKRYEKELYVFLRRFVFDRTVAEDLFQETFIQVHRNAHTFDPSRRFRPWLFTIAANKARDYLRAAGRKSTHSLDNTAGSSNGSNVITFLDLMEAGVGQPEDELIRQEDVERVREVITGLPEIYREVLLLNYFHRFAYKEIAEMLDLPLGTVKSRLHSALAYFARGWHARQEVQRDR
jgi:RNA polymerase sigma-70 factor (ECF subfamily)